MSRRNLHLVFPEPRDEGLRGPWETGPLSIAVMRVCPSWYPGSQMGARLCHLVGTAGTALVRVLGVRPHGWSRRPRRRPGQRISSVPLLWCGLLPEDRSSRAQGPEKCCGPAAGTSLENQRIRGRVLWSRTGWPARALTPTTAPPREHGPEPPRPHLSAQRLWGCGQPEPLTNRVGRASPFTARRQPPFQAPSPR